MNEKQLKLATYVIGACTLLVIIVLIIDLDTKNRLLRAADSLKEAINDGRIPAANNQGSGSDPDHNGSVPSNLVANGDAGMATSSPNGSAKRSTSARKGAARPGSGDSDPGPSTVN